MTIARMGASVLRTHTAHVRRKPWLPAILLILLALVLLISKAPHVRRPLHYAYRPD